MCVCARAMWFLSHAAAVKSNTDGQLALAPYMHVCSQIGDAKNPPYNHAAIMVGS
jgi:hypothetical protein